MQFCFFFFFCALLLQNQDNFVACTFCVLFLILSDTIFNTSWHFCIVPPLPPPVGLNLAGFKTNVNIPFCVLRCRKSKLIRKHEINKRMWIPPSPLGNTQCQSVADGYVMVLLVVHTYVFRMRCCVHDVCLNMCINKCMNV